MLRRSGLSDLLEALLTYTTPKLARFEDVRIGNLRTVLVLMILTYVGVYQFAWQGAWAESRPIAGSSCLTIQQPAVDSCDLATTECINAFHNKTQIFYCAEFQPSKSSQRTCPSSSVLPCEFYAAPLPVGSELNGATLAITRIKSTARTNQCHPDFDSCPNIFGPRTPQPAEENSAYVADMESFTVALDHTAWTTTIKPRSIEETVAARQQHGKLYVPKNDHLCRALGGHTI